MVEDHKVGVRRKVLQPADWEHLPDREILGLRIRDLGLRIQRSALEPLIEELYAELDARDIVFHPPCFLADEWFCPDKMPVIGIPFCLAHPRLTRIEQETMYEVEGGTPEDCLKLLRHECGHAVNYAYGLYRRTRWRELFGPFSTRYSTRYVSQPYSRRFVIHLDDNYAQAHPDEDFAETFAVWLTPGSDWEQRYGEWPVIRKLRYVDRVMRELAGKPAPCTEHTTPYSADRMTSTLAAHYERKRKVEGTAFPGYYDDALRRLFRGKASEGHDRKAARFLRRHQKHLVDRVTVWTGQRKYDVHTLIGKLIKRCEALNLYMDAPDVNAALDVATFVAVLATSTPRMQFEEERR